MRVRVSLARGLLPLLGEELANKLGVGLGDAVVVAVAKGTVTPAGVLPARAWPSPRQSFAPWRMARVAAAGPQSPRHCAPAGMSPLG